MLSNMSTCSYAVRVTILARFNNSDQFQIYRVTPS